MPDTAHTVIFQPSGARGKVAPGTTLRDAARQLGVAIESICAENATCGKCRVLIETGRFERLGITSEANHVSPIGQAEADYLEPRLETWRKTGQEVAKLRLACQARVAGDLLVFVPESSRANRQIVRKSASERQIDIQPAVRKYYVELEPATLAQPLGDWERLARALVDVMRTVHTERDWIAPNPDDLEVDYLVLRKLANALRASDWKVTATVWQDHQVIDVQPGYHEHAYGAAIDIGSTTIALYLCDLATGEIAASDTMMNPQVAYGEDILSRISYTINHEDGLETLNRSVIGALNTLLKRARRAKHLKPDDVLEVVLVGNTCMHHLVLNLPPNHLGLSPYVPTVQRALDIKARELGLEVNGSANVHVLPIEASFVGADNMGVLIAEEPYAQDEMWLIIDVGTNAELVLGNRQRLLCTSTPTGPAFEGAHVEYGMRAAPGAIEHVDIDPLSLEPHLRVIGAEQSGADGHEGLIKGICGSAIIDAVAEMYRVGIIDGRGRFVERPPSPRIRPGPHGMEYVLAWAADTSIGRDIPITLHDVRQIQLAKGALYVAARVLMRKMGIEHPDKIILAGGFGTYLDKTKAMVLGMIPDCPLENVYAVGNSAGDGARIALLNKDKRREAVRIARWIERIELPVDPDFQNQLMLALNFPHMVDPFPHIADLIPFRKTDPMAVHFTRSEART